MQQSPAYGLALIGYLDDNPPPAGGGGGRPAPVLGATSDLLMLVAAHEVDHVILGRRVPTIVVGPALAARYAGGRAPLPVTVWSGSRPSTLRRRTATGTASSPRSASAGWRRRKPLAADNGLRQRLVAAGAGPVRAHSMDAELRRTAAFLKGEREPVDTRAATLHRATPAVPSRLTLMSPSTFRPERAVPPAR